MITMTHINVLCDSVFQPTKACNHKTFWLLFFALQQMQTDFQNNTGPTIEFGSSVEIGVLVRAKSKRAIGVFLILFGCHFARANSVAREHATSEWEGNRSTRTESHTAAVSQSEPGAYQHWRDRKLSLITINPSKWLRLSVAAAAVALLFFMFSKAHSLPSSQLLIPSFTDRLVVVSFPLSSPSHARLTFSPLDEA